MAEVLKTNNMAKAPFKMKSSPAKATLADFFKSIGGKKTDMGKLRATQNVCHVVNLSGNTKREVLLRLV